MVSTRDGTPAQRPLHLVASPEITAMAFTRPSPARPNPSISPCCLQNANLNLSFPCVELPQCLQDKEGPPLTTLPLPYVPYAERSTRTIRKPQIQSLPGKYFMPCFLHFRKSAPQAHEATRSSESKTASSVHDFVVTPLLLAHCFVRTHLQNSAQKPSLWSVTYFLFSTPKAAYVPCGLGVLRGQGLGLLALRP